MSVVCMCRGRGTAWVAALPGGLPDVALLIDDVLVVVVDVERLLVVVGTGAEHLPLLNGSDLRRWFHISSLHNCISFLFLFDDYLEFRSSSIKHDRWVASLKINRKLIQKIIRTCAVA